MSSTAVTGAEQPEPTRRDRHHPQPGSATGAAEVLSLAHARDACMPEGDLSTRHACIDSAFDDLVQPLGLVGPNREVCRAAHLEAPAEFEQLVGSALARGKKPAALLVRMVKCGDHRKLAARPIAAPRGEDGARADLLEQRMAEEGAVFGGYAAGAQP